MRIRPDPAATPSTAVLECAEIMSLPAVEVYARLKCLGAKSSGDGFWRDSEFSEGLLRALEERGERLIDLGLARFSDDSEQLKRLWDRGVRELRHAILVNEVVGPGLVFHEGSDVSSEGIRVHGGEAAVQRLQELVTSPDPQQLALFVINPRTGTGWLNRLFSRRAPFDAMAEKEWIQLCGAALANPLLHEEPKESRYPTYPEGMAVRDLFAAVTRLLLTVEVSGVAADALSDHLHRVAELDLPATDVPPREGLEIGSEAWHKERRSRALEELQNLLRRWRAPAELLDEKGGEPFPFIYLRRSIVQILPRYPRELLDAIKDSDDQACRLGYYIARDYRTAQEVTADYERDGDEFLEAALENECLYRADHRDAATEYESLLHSPKSSDSTGDWENRQIMRHRRMRTAEALFERDPSVYLKPREVREDDSFEDDDCDWKPPRLKELRAQFLSAFDVLTPNNWTTQIRRAATAADELNELRFETTVGRINAVERGVGSLREAETSPPSGRGWSFIGGMIAGVVVMLLLHAIGT